MAEWGDLIFKCGELAAFIILTILFLNYITARDKDMTDLHHRCEDKLETIANRCLETLDKNTKATIELEKKIEYLLK